MSINQDETTSLSLAPNPPLEVPNQEMRQCICDGLSRLWQSQDLFDYTLVAEGRSFRVHRAVLASVSDYFYAMLTNGMKETQQDYVELKAINANMLQLLLDYVYTGILHITDDNVVGLLNAAAHLQLTTAITACLSFIIDNISVDNCMEILNIIRLHSSDRDFAKLDFAKLEDFVAQNFNLLFESGNYLLLSFESFKSLLCREELMFGPEEKLYQAVVQWLEHEPEKRKKFHNCLMEHIRFPLMTANQVDAIIKTHSELMTDTELMNDSVLNKNLKQAQEYLSKPVHQRVLCQNSQTRLRMKPSVLAIQDENGGEKWSALSKDKGKWYNVRKVDFQDTFDAECIIVNDFLLICGGSTEKCYIFDPREYKWTQLASMCEQRDKFSLVQHKGFLYALAGINECNWSASKEIECYNFKTNQWELFTEMYHEWCPVLSNAACVVNDSIYICNALPNHSLGFGDDPNPLASLDIPTKTWQMVPMKLRPDSFSYMTGANGFPMWSHGDLVYSVSHEDILAITWYDPKTGDDGLVPCSERLLGEANIVVDNERVYFINGTMTLTERNAKDGLCTEVILKHKSVQAINHLDRFPGTGKIQYCSQLRLPWHQFIFNEE